MKQLPTAWFEFNGTRSDAMHVRLMAMPKRPIAAEQGEQIEIPGRDGYLWSPRRDARAAISLSVDCTTEDGYASQNVSRWLTGSGLLRFSDDPNRTYQARVCDEYARESMFLQFDKQKFTTTFACQPHRYLYPEADTVVLTSAGYAINPCTASSLPRIKVTASGAFSIYIGAFSADVSGGSVIIDSELVDCFAADGVTLANSRVTMDEFPQLLPGGNAISWDGSVTSVEIQGRWRDL